MLGSSYPILKKQKARANIGIKASKDPFPFLMTSYDFKRTSWTVPRVTAITMRSQFRSFQPTSREDIDNNESENIEKEIERIKNIHGCHVIANGLINSLKYYLRLLSETSELISNYVDLIKNDTALKFEHKKKWNEIISAM